MEELNKNQIVLLTLLVSFVTSIATGIVTVSLVDQAPPAVTQTINRVVEKTVETIVPAKNQAAAIVTQQVPVVVKDEDLVIKAVETGSKSLVKISDVTDPANPIFVGMGIVVSKTGLVLANSEPYYNSQKYAGIFSDGQTFSLESKVSGKNIRLFGALIPDGKKTSFVPALLADSDGLKLGQSVVALSGNEERNSVAVGVISSILTKTLEPKAGEKDAKPIIYRSQIETNLKDFSGAYLVDLSGNVVALHIGDTAVGLKNYLPINLANAEMNATSTSATE